MVLDLNQMVEVECRWAVRDGDGATLSKAKEMDSALCQRAQRGERG